MTERTSFKLVCIAAILLLMLLAAFVEPFAGLSLYGTRALLLFICFLITFFGGILPGGLASLLFTSIMVCYGVYPSHSEALAQVSVPLIVFFIGSDAITTALKKTNIPLRIATFMSKISRGNSIILIVLLVEAGFILSSVMSNLAACAALATIAYGVYEAQRKSGASAENLGRCLMIGVPLGCGVGGVGTIAGSINNLTVLELFQQTTGRTIGFASWMAMMYPTCIIAMALGALIICLIFRPEPLSEEVVRASCHLEKSIGRMSVQEKKTVLVILLMLGFWIAGNWVPVLDTSFVALCGLVLFLLPGMESLTAKEWVRESSWDTILLAGGVMATVGGLSATGVIDWMCNGVVGLVGSTSPYVIGVIICALGFLVHAFFPVGGPVGAILTIPSVALAQACGLKPEIAALLVACGASGGTLLPVDLLAVMTKSYNLYTVRDYVRCGIPVTAALCLILPALLIPLAAWIGI